MTKSQVLNFYGLDVRNGDVQDVQKNADVMNKRMCNNLFGLCEIFLTFAVPPPSGRLAPIPDGSKS